jgi:hypothetical protein
MKLSFPFGNNLRLITVFLAETLLYKSVNPYNEKAGMALIKGFPDLWQGSGIVWLWQ